MTSATGTGISKGHFEGPGRPTHETLVPSHTPACSGWDTDRYKPGAVAVRWSAPFFPTGRPLVRRLPLQAAESAAAPVVGVGLDPKKEPDRDPTPNHPLRYKWLRIEPT